MSGNGTPPPATPARPAARRPRRPSLGPDEFLDKALGVFLEKGFEGASIEAITARAGIAKRTVYQRWGDKKSLFKAALRRAIEDWIVPVERLRAAETGELEGSLLAIGQILVDNLLSPAGLRLIRLTNAVSGHMPELGVYSVEQGTRPTLAYLADLFARHLGNGGAYAQADDAAEAFLHLVVGGPGNDAAWGVTRDKAAIDRRIRFSVRLFLHGLLPPGDAAPGRDVERLRGLLAETMRQLDGALARLEATG
jgi:AcrR family transcriptional regulator